MPEKPCEWAENPSGSVWECTAHNTQCAHKHADTNPDGSVNIFECRLGDPAYAFREIKRLQRLAQSYADTINKLIAVINNMNGAKTATQSNHVMDDFDAITAPRHTKPDDMQVLGRG